MCLQPPFNEEARAKAGFGPGWYLPLATPPKGGSAVAAAASPEPQAVELLAAAPSPEAALL